MVVAIILLDNDGKCVKSLILLLKRSGWVASLSNICFTNVGDGVAGKCRILTCIHSSCGSTVDALDLVIPLCVTPRPIGASIWEQFNKPEHSVSLGKDEKDFCCQEVRYPASNPPSPSPLPPGVKISYCLHTPNGDKSQFLGSTVLSPHGLCPPFDACPNTNLFQHFFGIKFHYKNHTHVQGISQFEFACCFGFIDNLTYHLSKPANKYCLNTAVPARTSVWLFNQVFDHLVLIHNMNCKILCPHQYAAPAATIQSFVNSAVGSRLPSCE